MELQPKFAGRRLHISRKGLGIDIPMSEKCQSRRNAPHQNLAIQKPHGPILASLELT
jgi:hypothetical protein